MNALRWGRRGIGGVLLLHASLAPLRAQRPTPVRVAGLGALTFPVTTASPAARTAFLRGTMLLHLFHYEEAVTAYRSAQRLDPEMTMAWWGEAMAFNYGVWDEQYPDSARAALARLAPTAAMRAAKARSRRERDYLAAVEVLFGAGSKPRRDTLYAAEMARLSQHYPDDDEARLFHALALLALNQGVRDTASYRRAYLLANDVLVRHPEHSGAAHYVIHATDDPDHADAGLPAARLLARSAPAADHAQHMTSHIFMARGMWDALVAANQRASHTDANGRPMAGMPDGADCGHYTSWLHYGYLAQGRIPLATLLLEGCQALSSKDTTRSPGGAISMWVRQLLDTEEWSGAQSEWRPAARGDGYDRETWHFGHGFAAARRGDLVAAATDLLAMRQATREVAAQRTRAKDNSPEAQSYRQRARVLDLELQAVIASARKERDAALRLLRSAALISDAIPYAFGPPFIDKPVHELLGEELLTAGQQVEARAEFVRALRETPNRPLAVRGAARAAQPSRPP